MTTLTYSPSRSSSPATAKAAYIPVRNAAAGPVEASTPMASTGFLSRLAGLFRRPPIDQSHEHVDTSDLIPARTDWPERAARSAGV